MAGSDTPASSTPPPDPVIEAYKRDVDVSLLRENLKLTVQQRFERLMQLQEFAEELRRSSEHRS